MCPDSIYSVQLLSRVRLLETPWTAACQASLSITISQSLLKFMSIESVMPSNDLLLCRPLLLPPSIFPSIRVFSNESVSKYIESVSKTWKKRQERSINAVVVSISVLFSSVAQSCLTLCDPMDCSTPRFPIHHQLLELAQTHVRCLVMPSNHLILCHPLLLLP